MLIITDAPIQEINRAFKFAILTYTNLTFVTHNDRNLGIFVLDVSGEDTVVNSTEIVNAVYEFVHYIILATKGEFRPAVLLGNGMNPDERKPAQILESATMTLAQRCRLEEDEGEIKI